MEKTRKKTIKRIVAWSCAAAVILLLAALPLILQEPAQEDGPKASILSGKVQEGTIDKEVIGGGTLAWETSVSVSVPAAVQFTGVEVTNGQMVTEGTVLATVDRVSVMTAITQVQETLEHLAEEMEDARKADTKDTVKALAGGTVKHLYAQKGDSVEQVMLQHGALAVLSLDGLMAVDLEADSDLRAGDQVTVTLTDGTAVNGEVAVNLEGEMTVTLADQGYTPGENVQVTTEGTLLGSGNLYIYSPWSATAYDGTVESVKVKEGDTLRANAAILTITGMGYSAQYRQLVALHQEYEALMLQLFQMYQTETVIAPCDGMVSGLEEGNLSLLSAEGQAQLVLLANAPNGNDEMLYTNYMGQVSVVAENGWLLKLDPQALEVSDYLTVMEQEVKEEQFTRLSLYTHQEVPVYTLQEGAWGQVEYKTIGQGDVLLFAADDQGEFVWTVLIKKAEPQAPDTPQNPEGEGNQGGNQGDNQGGNQGGFPNSSMGGGSFPSGGNFGNITQEPEFEAYSLDMTLLAEVIPQNTMTLEITVDEQDVRSLQVGMEAQVQVDAAGGEKYTATITQVGNTGTNNGGSSKYTVELTLPCNERLLGGMNATATVVLSTTQNVLTIPVAALVEKGNTTLVYTARDAEGNLKKPVEVQAGVTDGDQVEILSGLTQGQTYYYAYYDTLEISNTPEFSGGMNFGR